MQTVAEYFSRPDTPRRHSPTGVLMLKVLEKCPELEFDAARAKANELLAISAKGKVYRTPRVLSDAELAQRSERLKRVFPKSAVAA
jgi:hypothetical protein